MCIRDRCKDCVKEKYSTPEQKEKIKLRSRSPSRKAYHSTYGKTPEYKAKAKERRDETKIKPGMEQILRRKRIQTRFKLAPEKFDKLLQNQQYSCAICKTQLPESELQVDHCHNSGKIRGLLCFSCNLSLGMFKDNIQLLRKAVEYLKISKEKGE